MLNRRKQHLKMSAFNPCVKSAWRWICYPTFSFERGNNSAFDVRVLRTLHLFMFENFQFPVSYMYIMPENPSFFVLFLFSLLRLLGHCGRILSFHVFPVIKFDDKYSTFSIDFCVGTKECAFRDNAMCFSLFQYHFLQSPYFLFVLIFHDKACAIQHML